MLIESWARMHACWGKRNEVGIVSGITRVQACGAAGCLARHEILSRQAGTA